MSSNSTASSCVSDVSIAAGLVPKLLVEESGSRDDAHNDNDVSSLHSQTRADDLGAGRTHDLSHLGLEDGGFISRVSTAFENFHKESVLLNSELIEVPVYENDLFDPLSRAATAETVTRRRTGGEKASAASSVSEIEDDGLYNADDIIDPPPDGGYGWVCCACVVAMNFCTWGPNTCYGVFLSYYLSSHYFKTGTATDFAVIGGLMLGLTLLLLPLSAMCMNKFGYRAVTLCGVVLQCVSFVSSSFVNTVGQLYFTYGILLGIANGLIFGCNSVVIPGWFLKRRAFANGLTHIGVGLGGLVLTFAVHAIMDKTGSHKWPMRFLGMMTLVINTISVLIVKVRVPKNPPPKKSSLQLLKDVYDIKVYKTVALQYSTMWSTFTNIGYVILLFSLSNYAISIGLSSTKATATLAIFNGSQIIGRPGMGYFSEKLGRANCTIICMIYTLVLLGPFWFNVKTYSSVLAFAFMLGLSAGVCSVSIIPLTADVTGMAHFPAGLGYNNIWNGSTSIVAEIFALKLRDYSLAQPYRHCQIFVLVMYFVGLLALIPYREWKVRRMLNAKVSAKSIDEKIKQKWRTLLEPGTINYFKRAFYLIRC